jgi:DNA invertase Pin-like site-specific DNA recombinase
MAIFGYGRVSTYEQTTQNQRLELEKLGYAIEDDYWYADEGISGNTAAMQRPRFAALLQQIRKGETLVVTKIDRLGRDVVDINQTIKLLKDRGIELIVIQFGKMDLNSPAGRILAVVIGAVAQIERDLLIERTQAGLARAKAQGVKLGRKPKTTQSDRIGIDQSYRNGASVSELSRKYSISRATVLNVLRSFPKCS